MLQFIKKTQNDDRNIEEAAIALSMETGYDLSICRLLCMRGIFDKKAAESFLQPSFSQLCDPFLFTQMKKATERLETAKAKNEKLCIYGDYDVDGVCATSILYIYLKYAGYNVTYYIPSRRKEGYGMNAAAIEELAESGVQLIISVDNGITAHKEIALARELGMDVIITDHHKCTGEPPVCTAVICHTCEGETYPNRSLCGAGIALKLVHALGGEAAMREFIPYAGLATVADVVELSGENRAIVSLALKAVNADECPVGIKALTDTARPKRKEPVSERDFAFGLAPRLNAAGRMSEACLGVELLCSQNYEEAHTLAEKLDTLNSERREEEAKILSEAEAQIRELNLTDTRILVLKSENWNPGIVGIAAAKLAEKYYRPTILLAQNGDELTGSARSVPDIDLFDAMNRFSDLCIKFGGHSFAAGLTLKEENFEKYRELINDYIINAYPVSAFVPKKYYDDEADLKDISVAFTEMLQKLAPFGEGNQKPVFLARGITFNKLSRIGAELNHINGKVCMNNTVCDIVAFDKGYMFDTLINTESCDMLFSPSVNEWSGSKHVQLRALDFSPAPISDAENYFFKKKPFFMDAFAKNLLADCNEAAAPVQECTESLIKSSFASSYDGTLVLCMDEKSACRTAKLINNTKCMAEIAFSVPNSDIHAFNTVLCAPVLNELKPYARNYYRIVVCGCISNTQLNAITEIFAGASIYLCKGGEISSEACAFAQACERKNMGKIYTCILKRISGEAVYREELLDYASRSLCTDKQIISFATDCFVELGLFFADKNDRISANNDGRKVELSDSALYRNARDFPDRTCNCQKK